MKRLFHLQIFVFVIIVALIGNFNTYAQNKGKGLKDIQRNLQGVSKVVPNYTPDNITAVSLPIVENFETINTVFPPVGWSAVDTTTNGLFVLQPGISGYGIGTYSLGWNFYNTFPGDADLITPEFILTGVSYPKLSFDWAYATYPGSFDELDIYYSTDAGTNWSILLAMPGGTSGILNPFGLSQTSPYLPTANQWSTLSLALPAGTNMIKFTGVSDYGNLLWLDNVKIGDTFFDTFETPPYTFPGQVACQNPTNWTTWSNSPCGNDDATISTNYAFSGTQSALIDNVPPRDVDLVNLHGAEPLATGKWYIGFRFYIPAGNSGYFNIQSFFDGLGASASYGLSCYFNAGGAGSLEADVITPFNWVANNWNNCLVIVDLDTETAEFWVGPNAMTQIYSWEWTQGGTVHDSLDGIDLFGAALTDKMYVDNFFFSNVPPPIPQPVNEVGTATIDMDYQYAPGTIVPKATVKNYGIGPNSFNVNMTITGGYTSTKTVTALAPGATTQVTFDNWNATTVGAYTVNVSTQLTGDEDPINDSKSLNVNIWDESGVWTSGADYPITSYNGIGVSYNDGTTDWLYVMGGNTTSGLRTECYKYNVTANTWTSIAPLPESRLIAAGAVVGNYIYVIGGADGSTNLVTYHNTTYRYDIVGNTWSQVATLPLLYGWGRAVAYNDGTKDYIYLAGGIEQDLTGATFYIADVYLYDVTANTWTLTLSPLPDGIFGGGFSIVGNTLVYATGATPAGISNVVYVGTINPADPTDITWETKRPYPGNIEKVYDTNGTDVMATMPNLSIGNSKNGHPLLEANFPAGGIYRNHAHPWGADAIIIGAGTPTSSYPHAGPSPCYVYKPGTDTWTAQENVPVTTGAHSSGTFHDGNTWKYIIVSGYGETVPVAATQIYTQTLGGATTFALNLAVTDGWNMVSVPGTNPSGMGVSTWWPNRNTLADVYKWNGSYTVVTLTDPGEGYWMLHNGAQTYNYPAIQIVAHDPIPLTAGWNMIGGYENTPSVAGLTTTPPGLIVTGTVYGWNGTYFNPTNLVPGFGYWVLSNGNGVINPPTLADGPAKLVAQDDKSDWGKITITDASGKSYTLYSVNGEVNLNQYSMPPLPPAGMFDVRYSSNRKAENLKDNNQTIEMRGLEYPVTVRAEKMDLKLQDETGKVINVNLKAGEDVVISDARIQKLMVSGELIPTVYALEQNYPNPFNPSTKIEFSIPEDVNNVTLTIFNTLGQKVAELVNSKLEAGKYSYVWNASDVATGLYIYELRTDKFVSVKKMMLLK